MLGVAPLTLKVAAVKHLTSLCQCYSSQRKLQHTEEQITIDMLGKTAFAFVLCYFV